MIEVEIWNLKDKYFLLTRFSEVISQLEKMLICLTTL